MPLPEYLAETVFPPILIGVIWLSDMVLKVKESK
jgi:hypothetical protein